MANEATFSSSVNIRKVDASGNIQLEYRNTPTSFRTDVTGIVGPTPGAFNVTTAGVNVDFSELTTPTICVIYNLGNDYRFDVGIWDADNSQFFPLLEVPPHEFYPLRLSRNLAEEYGTGTGTIGAGNNAMRLKAIGGSTYARVDAFEQ